MGRQEASSPRAEERREFKPGAIIVSAVFAIAAVALLWYLFDVLLLIFAAVLIAVLVHAPAQWLAQRSGVSHGWALAIVLLLIVLLAAAAGWLVGSAVAQQFAAIAEQAPQMLQELRNRLQGYGWWSESLNPRTVLEGQQDAFLGRGLRVVSATFGAVANLLLILFMAVLFAAQPGLYVRGTVRLVPPSKRHRAVEVLDRVGQTLRRWLLGQLVLMIFVGVCSVIGLWLIGVSNAAALGLLAGLLTFVPFIGPLFAAAVAILISFADGLMTVIWVALLYLGIQTVEGMLEPIVQQRAVYLPPVLLLVSQVALGVLVGLLGVVLATPLAAVLLVAVQMLYVEDVLGDSTT